MTTYAGRPLPVWQILDRETGELIDTVPSGSHQDLALMAGSTEYLFRHEVAHNVLTNERIYR